MSDVPSSVSRSHFSSVSPPRPFPSLHSFGWTAKLPSFRISFQLCVLLVVASSLASSCPYSGFISKIETIETCNGSDFVLTFNFETNISEGLVCEFGIYLIHIFTHNTLNSNLSTADMLNEAQRPVYDNATNMCTSYFIIPGMTYEKYNGKLLQIWMHNTLSRSRHCSNNFTAIIGTDPPDPVNTSSIVSIVNCTGVYLYWTPPVTPTGCHILNYTLEWDDIAVETEEPFHYWLADELPSNETLTVSIEAVNVIGPSEVTSINISTAVEPVVNIVNHTVVIVSSTARLIVNAELDSDCPFSFPNLLHICTTCNDNTSPFCSYINLTIFNDPMITINTPLPLDLHQCVSTLTWSNFHSSFISYINDTFSTSPVHSVFILASSSTGYFRVNCTLLPGGSGCVIRVFNSSGFFIFMEVLTLNYTVTVSDDDYKVLSKTTTHRLTANGMYSVNVYSLRNSDIVGGVVIDSRVIEVILPSPSPSLVSTPSPSPSLVSTSSPSNTPPPSLSPSLSSSPSPSCSTDCSDSNSLGAIIGGVFGGIIGIILIVCFIFCVVRLAKHYNCQPHVQYEVERRAQNGTEQFELNTIKNGTFKRFQQESTRAAGEAKSSERPLLNGSQSATDTGPGDDVKSPTSDANRTIPEESYQTNPQPSATGDLRASAPVMKELKTEASSDDDDDDDKREYTLDIREHDPRPQITERKIQESQAVDHNIEVNPM